MRPKLNSELTTPRDGAEVRLKRPSCSRGTSRVIHHERCPRRRSNFIAHPSYRLDELLHARGEWIEFDAGLARCEIDVGGSHSVHLCKFRLNAPRA